MKGPFIIAVFAILIVIAGTVVFLAYRENASPVPADRALEESIVETKRAAKMLLTSPSFEYNAKIPPKFTCEGVDVNPELQVQNVPPGARSLALIVDDPDATRGNFTHWLVWNIDPGTTIIKEESKPPGSREGLTDFGRAGYGGPCPPRGAHRYFFRLYALDAVLNLPEHSDRKELEKEIKNHLIEKTELMGLYEKQQ